MDTVDSLAKNVITAKTPFQLPVQLAKGLPGVRKFIPDVAVFQDTVNAFLSMLTRAAGERGVLTTQDVERIRKALPQLSDTKQIADNKMQQLRNLFTGIQTGTSAAFLPTNPTESIKPRKSVLDYLKSLKFK